MGSIDEAVAALRAGELVVYPTETFYGIAADPFSARAIERLFAVKGRDPQNPIALIASDTAMAFRVAERITEKTRRLARAFWPGPLTLVLPAREEIPRAMVGPNGGVGVRVSPHPIARAICERIGGPITATSANLSGAPPARSLAQARSALGARISVYLDGGELRGVSPSTVVDCSGDAIRVIRAGAIAECELEAILSGVRN
jgi:L-threonylcarbamoyladenylate synthase